MFLHAENGDSKSDFEDAQADVSLRRAHMS